MRVPFTYALRFRGEAVALGQDRYWAESRARDGTLVRALGPGGAVGRLDGFEGGDPVCRHELDLRGDGSFASRGEIRFGAGNALTFSAHGRLGDAPAPRLRHGRVLYEVTGGSGWLAGATGSISSQFLLADDGELTDHQLGLLFVEEAT
jgi:hypothetical protein